MKIENFCPQDRRRITPNEAKRFWGKIIKYNNGKPFDLPLPLCRGNHEKKLKKF